ncbi:MAG TPA: hypothetical protein DIS90_05135 [Cytophagales bacterium]|nr:hypothetical protein [Cytophagales bacterium]
MVEKNKFIFWQKWLTWANIMTIGVGLMVAFGGNTFFFEAHNHYTRDVFFGSEAFPEQTLMLKNWLFGIIGGTIVGFHVLMVMISEYAFKEQQKWAYHAMWYGLLSWFVIDSGVSFYYGAIHNIVLINLVALVLIGLPLVMTRGSFSNNEE